LIPKDKPFQWPFVMVSDVHLRQPDDARARLLELVIARCRAGDVECLLLGGDIFDFCFGGSAWFRNKFAGIGNALETLAASGTRVIFVEGNHEFDLRSMGWSGVEIRTERDFAIELRNGLKIQVCHGDLLLSHWTYRVFRFVIKARITHLAARLIPGKWFDLWALNHAKNSRARDEYRTLDHQALMASANRWLDQTSAQHGFFGHFHVPYAEPRAGRNDGRILSVESWDRPNLLVYGPDGFSRVNLKHDGESTLLEAKSILDLRK